MTLALVLAGHGSHISAQTAGLVWSHVDALRRLGVADEVTAAFWKEAPSFHTVVSMLAADDITIVPLFTAQGYFTQTVIPAEMGLAGPLTQRDGRTIRYARTLNEHPYLAQMVQRRVREALDEHRLAGKETAVAIIGHSTRRNPESRQATEAQAEQLRALGWVAQVRAVYLDDAPEIAEIYRLTSAPNLIAVPYFLALGSHTTIDVPDELGLEPGRQQGTVEGRRVFYTAPVGVDPALQDVIVELAREAGGIGDGVRPLTPNPSSSRPPATPSFLGALRTQAGRGEPDGGKLTESGDAPSLNDWRAFPAAGREALWRAVKAAGVLRFGGLRLMADEVRAWGDEAATDVIVSPGALRARVREHPFRSLPTSDDLPGGWLAPVNSASVLHGAVETIYPGAVADWATERAGTFRVTPLKAVAARQTGMYRKLEDLPPARAEAVVERVCGRCVRGPSWFFGVTPPERLPCPEACNHWLSAALEEL